MSLSDLLEVIYNLEALEVVDAYNGQEIYKGKAKDCPWRTAVFATVKAVAPGRPQDGGLGLRIQVSLSR